jgi:hypothetical protein
MGTIVILQVHQNCKHLLLICMGNEMHIQRKFLKIVTLFLIQNSSRRGIV